MSRDLHQCLGARAYTGQRPVPPFIRALALCALMISCAACSPLARRPPQPLSTSLQELLPHQDRDHFVYLWRQVVGGRQVAGIHVEHLTALNDSGEFDVTLSENGAVIGHTRFRDDGRALLLVSETLGRNLQLSYDPPLPQIEVPLFPGETRAAATAVVSGAADSARTEGLEVTQVVEAAAAPAVRTALGTYERAVRVRTVRTLQFARGPVELRTTSVLVPGIGEIRSEGKASGAPALYRELACATIGGRHIGNCRNLKERIEEWERAGPTDAP